MEVVIVGGGVSGLCCMNALLDKGIKPLLLEAGQVGTPKLCGEFLAPKACSYLKAWGIGPIQPVSTIAISDLRLHAHAGAMSRSEVELQLAQRAKSLGGIIQEQCKVDKLEDLHPKQLFIASGRFGVKPTHVPYIGLKAHFAHDDAPPTLSMHLFKGGYFGIVPISSTHSNIACLVQARYKDDALSLMNKNVDFLTAPVPPFGLKEVPTLPNVYWIGDAIASLPPASGGGFCHAVHSALLAVHHSLHGSPTTYQQELKAHLLPHMRWAKLVHNLMLTPAALPIMRWFPSVPQALSHKLFT
jgi:flavin-dependent dehydrogenase